MSPLRLLPVVLIAFWLSASLRAQPVPAAAGPAEADGMVQLNIPPDSELKILIEYVSQRLSIKILYDEEVQNKKITIRAPEKIPAESLLQVLESALRMKGLALVDADIEGWKRIVKSDDLVKIAQPELDAPLADRTLTQAVTQAFRLKYVTPQKMAEIVKPFLTEPGANTISLAEQNVLVVTDYVDSLRRVEQLIAAVDRAGPEAVLQFYEVQHVEAAALQKQITEALAARIAGEGGTTAATGRLQITADERTNQLLLVGTPDQVREAKEVAEAFDVELGIKTEVYNFQYVEAARIDKLVKDLFSPLVIKRLYQSALDTEDNLLIATTTTEIHDRIEWLQKQLDVEAKRPGSAIQFYRLKYADAVEVLQTIQSIQQTSAGPVNDFRGVSPLGRGRWNNNQYSQPTGFQGRFAPGPNFPVAGGAGVSTAPPAYVPPPAELDAAGGIAGGYAPGAPPLIPGAPEESAAGLLANAAQVTADPSSNTIIVVADRPMQEMFKNLIEYLDKRRPQVLVEAKVVIIDTSDDFSLGVEISGGDRTGVGKLFQFTSYGLSTVNPTTGALALIPGRGFNWTLVDPDTADAVVRALATHRRAKVTSSPRILVNDNATGTLASVAEVPFTSVNASNTVATTSFAGFAEAGTTIEVTPRISDDDHLELDYVVTLNSFTGSGGAGVPPPRQTDEVASTVTIPDGYTVIVGGLNRENVATARDGIPILENIPIVRLLSSAQVRNQSKSSLFIFLRPVILRDDRFADLKYFSDRDLRSAAIGKNFPTSCPKLVR